MPRSQTQLLAFNRGEVSKLALQRIDVEKLRMAAACQVNWLPYVQGPMSLRPGFLAVGEVLADDPCRVVPFVFSKLDTALLEFTDSNMRVWLVSGSTETLLSRVSVATTVNNGNFAATGTWSLVASSGASATISSNLLTLTPTVRGGVTTCTQQLTIAGPDQGKEHALRITVPRGPVVLRVGTSSGTDELITRTVLDTGTHSLAFTPPGASAYIQFEATATFSPTCQARIVSGCQIEAAGTVTIPTQWANADLPNIRFDQSGDIVFAAAKGKQQQKIERRAAHSWSVVTYYSNNGPFDTVAFSDAKLRLGAVDGNTTLNADKNIFKSGHVGALFSLFVPGQSNTYSLGAASVHTDAVRVAGVGADRSFSVSIAGTWSGNLRIRRSYTGPTDGFIQVDTKTANGGPFSYDGNAPPNNQLDNIVVWYHVGFEAGDYTSGNAQVTLSYNGGGRTAIVRVLSYVSATQVNVEILQSPGDITQPTGDWQMSLWGDPSVASWPTSVAFHEGRLGWYGPDLYLSEPDGYYDFRAEDADGNSLGDQAVIIERFGSGPVDTVSWGLSLTRLLCGREQSIASVRSSNFDQALAPNAVVQRDCSDQGAERLPAVKAGKRGIFVQQSGRRVYELAFNAQEADYGDRDLTRLNLDIGAQGFVDVAKSVQPDKMVWLPRGDGQCAALLYDVEDDVVGWWRLQTLGVIENICVLPSAGLEDTVYFVVRRTVNAVTRRFIEKLALRSDCVGGALNKQLDCAIVYSGSPVSTLQHSLLPNTLISVWADGAAIGTVTTDGAGNFTMPDNASHSNVVAGLAGAVVTVTSTGAVNEFVIGSQYGGYPCEVFADIGGTGNLKHIGPLAISGGVGVIDLPNGAKATKVVAFIGYVAPFYSAKIVHSLPGVSPIDQRKELGAIGLILYDTAAQGLSFGQTPDLLDNMPLVEAEQAVAAGTVWSEYEEPITVLPGRWDTDSRLLLLAQAPNPCTVGAVAISIAGG